MLLALDGVADAIHDEGEGFAASFDGDGERARRAAVRLQAETLLEKLSATTILPRRLTRPATTAGPSGTGVTACRRKMVCTASTGRPNN